jgi:hypothetical protein
MIAGIKTFNRRKISVKTAKRPSKQPFFPYFAFWNTAPSVKNSPPLVSPGEVQAFATLG